MVLPGQLASGPVLTFVSCRGVLVYECQNHGDSSKRWIPVWFWICHSPRGIAAVLMRTSNPPHQWCLRWQRIGLRLLAAQSSGVPGTRGTIKSPSRSVLGRENQPLLCGRVNSRKRSRDLMSVRFRGDISRSERPSISSRTDYSAVIGPCNSFILRAWRGTKQIPLDRGRFLQRLAADLILVRSRSKPPRSIATIVQRRGP